MFRERFDELLKKHKIDEAKEYSENCLYEAITNKDTFNIIVILNEMIGFYRDLNEYDVSLKYANSLANIISKVSLNNDDYASSLINIANSYRVNELFNEAINLFNEAISICTNGNIKASGYNNLALTYLGLQKYDEAILNFENALKFDLDDIKKATTYTNLASCYFYSNRFDLCMKYIDLAHEIFRNNEDDFHYMGYITLLARVKAKSDDRLAIEYYEKALQSIMQNVGRTKLYGDVEEELFTIYDKYNIEKHIGGVKLSQMYFESVKEEFLSKFDYSLQSKLTIGLFGLGSECYNQSDLISEDHDFDPGFICLVEDSVSSYEFNLVKEAYENLPKKFNRFYIFSLDKNGVHYYSQYLKDFLGVTNIDDLTEQSKSLITNGKIFYSANSSLVRLRKKIERKNKEEYVIKLSLKTLEINQYIPYNLNRAKQRNDLYTYQLLKNHLVDKLIEYYYIYHLKFMPHDKLQLKMIDKNSIIYKWICQILDDDVSLELCETISSHLLKALNKYGVVSKIETIYIEDYKEEIVDYLRNYKEKLRVIEQILTLELPLFKSCNNIGEVSNCQLNDSYFKLMRKSQFIVYSIECLESYLNDLKLAKENNYNIVSFKYGFMMKDYDYENYKLIENMLPTLSPKQEALIEEIVKIQLESKIEFDKTSDSSNMRVNFTKLDTINNVSYETYLRGELKSYSEKTMFLYGANLVEMIKKNRNIVNDTIAFTYLFKCDEQY